MSVDAAEELATAQRAVRLARRAFGATHSVFVRTMRAVMDAYRQARVEGVSREDAACGIEETLRSVWPHDTTHYPPQCDTCDDVGLEERMCRVGRRCGRPFCARRGQEWEHRYAVPCACVQGARWQPKVASSAASLEAAGKVKRKRGWSQVGG